jgi:hypothetical protein
MIHQRHLAPQGRVLRQEYRTQGLAIHGTIVDRQSVRRTGNSHSNSDDRGTYTGPVHVDTAYFIKVQYYQVISPENLLNNQVIHRVYPVSRDVYYGPSSDPISLVVLPQHPRSALLQIHLEEDHDYSDRRGWILASLLIAMGLGVIVLLKWLEAYDNDDKDEEEGIPWQYWAILDSIALGFHVIALLVLWIQSRRLAQQHSEDCRAGQYVSSVEAVAADVQEPPPEGSHDYHNGYSINGIITYPEQEQPATGAPDSTSMLDYFKLV